MYSSVISISEVGGKKQGSERPSNLPEVTQHCSSGLPDCGLEAVLRLLTAQLKELTARGNDSISGLQARKVS